jgi:hypothetical protein
MLQSSVLPRSITYHQYVPTTRTCRLTSHQIDDFARIRIDFLFLLFTIFLVFDLFLACDNAGSILTS